jgi:DNA-binding transcriptional LysR family regulator
MPISFGPNSPRECGSSTWSCIPRRRACWSSVRSRSTTGRNVERGVFDPKKERSNFRISGPDNVCVALLPHLCRRYTTERYKVNFDFLPWQADAVDMLERGKLDLILHIDDGLLPSHFSSERLYREDWICAVARQSKFGDRLTLKQYLAAEHLIVTTLPSVQNIPDKQLAALGAKRRSSVRMPDFGAALSCLPGTELVLTLTNGMRQMVKRNWTLRLVKAPHELRSFHFLMVWHPRLTTDVRHTWLRKAMRQVCPQEAFGATSLTNADDDYRS